MCSANENEQFSCGICKWYSGHKAFNRSNSSYGQYSKAVNYFHDCTMEWWRECWLWNAAARAVLPSTLLGTLPIGALLFMNGSITLPVLMICLIVPLGFTGPLMKVSEAMEQVNMIKGNLEQVTTFLNTLNCNDLQTRLLSQNRHLNLVTFALVIIKPKYYMISHLRHHRNQ